MTYIEVWRQIEERIFEDEAIRLSAAAPEHLLQRYTSLVEQCEATGGWTLLDRFLRFITATTAMQHFTYTRELTQVHAWIVRGLTDKYQGTQVEEVSTIIPFLFASDLVISNSPYFYDVLVKWLGLLYYYCAEQSALDDFGEAYLTLSIDLCSRQNPRAFDYSYAFLLARLVTWTVQTSNPRAPEVTRLCETLVKNTKIAGSARVALASTLLSRSGRLSQHSYSYWASYTLENFSSELRSEDLLALLVRSWDGCSGTLSENLLHEVKCIREELVSNSHSELACRVLEDGRVELIKPMLGTAIKSANFEFLRSATAVWYGVRLEYSLASERILWQAPLEENGYLGLRGTSKLTVPRSSNDQQRALVAATNRFLGTSISVRGEPSVELHIPDELGKPSGADAQKFEAALVDAYLPPETVFWLKEQAKEICSQIIVPSSAHPVQALQIKILNTTWPLASSFMTPLQDAKVCKVAIWSSGGLMSPDHEIDALRAIFKKNGIDVEVFTAGGDHGKSFIQIYEDASYQVIWLISHGEYDHFSPKEARLEIGADGTSVGMGDLLDSKFSLTTRRLLVLNVCDGATHPGEGVLPRLGFAASLAFPWQATISHKWPVAPIPAAVLGALLANQIALGRSFFDAYKGMVAEMLHVADLFEMADRIDAAAGIDTELAERVRRCSHNLAAFEHYASASFFE
jgi:hypothetical protein